MNAINFYIQNLPLALLIHLIFYIPGFTICAAILFLDKFKGQIAKIIFLFSFIIAFFLIRQNALMNRGEFNYDLQTIFWWVLVWSIYYFPFFFIWKKISIWSARHNSVARILALVLILVIIYLYFQNHLLFYGICRPGMKTRRIKEKFGRLLECYAPSIYEEKICEKDTDCGSGQCLFLGKEAGVVEVGVCADAPRRSSKDVVF